MVRVISVHHFESQSIQTCEEALAVAAAPPDRLLIALPQHVIEVRDLSSPSKRNFSFPTVDRVSYLAYCSTAICLKFCENGFHLSAHNLLAQNKVNVDCKISSQLQEIKNHFSYSKKFVSEMKYITPKLLERPKYPDTLYLCNESLAESIVNVIKLDVKLENTIVLELNPGFGFITERLLKLDVPLIKVFEKDTYFNERLTLFGEFFPNRLQIYKKTILHLRSLSYMDSFDGGSRLSNVMKEVEQRDWNDEPNFIFVGTLTKSLFVHYLTRSIIRQEGIIHYGRLVLYLITEAKMSADLTPHFSYISPFPTLCRILFDAELINAFNRKDFIPWPNTKKKKNNIKAYKDLDHDQLYLIKITPKKDLYDKIGGMDNLRPLWFFTRQMCKSGKNRVIPQIEKWMPGCGYRLIALNINVFTVFEDLSTDQILQVFIEITKWPEYKDSSFLHAMETLSSNSMKEDEMSEKIDEKVEETFENEEDNEPVEDH